MGRPAKKFKVIYKPSNSNTSEKEVIVIKSKLRAVITDLINLEWEFTIKKPD